MISCLTRFWAEEWKQECTHAPMPCLFFAVFRILGATVDIRRMNQSTPFPLAFSGLSIAAPSDGRLICLSHTLPLRPLYPALYTLFLRWRTLNIRKALALGLEDSAAAQTVKAHVHAYVNAFYFCEEDLVKWIKVRCIFSPAAMHSRQVDASAVSSSALSVLFHLICLHSTGGRRAFASSAP